jgi:alkaline phosphatase
MKRKSRSLIGVAVTCQVNHATSEAFTTPVYNCQGCDKTADQSVNLRINGEHKGDFFSGGQDYFFCAKIAT